MGRTPLRRLLLTLLFVAEFLGESSTTGMRLVVAAAKESSSNNNSNNKSKKTSSDATSSNGPFSALHHRYEKLSPKGRAIAGATVGFVGSRLALRTVTRVVKFGAAAFITAEVLKLTGVLDDLEMPGLSAEQSDMIQNAKSRILRTTEDYRREIRRQFNRQNIESFFDQERMFAFGFAGGAVAGAML